jgi:plastocyanin
MKAAVIAISAGVLAISMALPALLFAQEAPPATPAETAPPAETPPAPTDPADPAAADPAAAGTTTTEVAGTQTTPTATAPVPKGSASVQMRDFSFSPASVTVNVGDSVTWSNTGAEDHDAASSAFTTGTVPPGGSATETFSSAGNFSYVCSFHPQMKGTVNVVGTTGPGTGGTDPGTTPAPGTEAAAVAGTDAAGSSSALPSTGQEEPPLLIIGLGLVGCGAISALLARWREREELS